jgi:hypothetical protein
MIDDGVIARIAFRNRRSARRDRRTLVRRSSRPAMASFHARRTPAAP